MAGRNERLTLAVVIMIAVVISPLLTSHRPAKPLTTALFTAGPGTSN